MKVNKYMIFVLILSILFSLSAVAAQENITLKQNDLTDTLTESFDSNHHIEMTEEERLSDETHSFSEIQEKIDNSSSGDIIYLDGKSYMGSAPINVNKDNLTITGESPASDKFYSFLDGGQISTIMNITASNIVIKNILFINGKSTGSGGAIYSMADYWNGIHYNNITINMCSFIKNKAEYGGAIYLYGSENSRITNCNFVNNDGMEGGAIDMYGFNILLSNSLFRDNEGVSSGAVKADISDSIITNCNFTNNLAKSGDGHYYAEGSAGALSIRGDNVRLFNSDFTGNRASNIGGAVLWDSYIGGTVYNCTFTNNHANSSGALGANGYNITLSDSRFINNTASHTGGGLIWNVEDSLISNNEFTLNSATYGGAIYSPGDNVMILNNKFSSNSASRGNVIWVDGPNNSIMDNIIENSNINAIYVTNSTNLTYNNISDKQITYDQYIIDVDLDTIIQVNENITVKIHVHDMFGNPLQGQVYVTASTEDGSYYSYDEDKLVDGKKTFNLKPVDKLTVINVTTHWDNEGIVRKELSKRMQILVADIQQLTNNTVMIRLPENSTGNVTLKLGDKLYSSNLSNSTASVYLTGLVNGSFNAEISYENFTCNMTVKITNSNLTTSIITLYVMGIIGETFEIPVSIMDSLGNPVDGAIINCKIPSIGYDSNETSRSGTLTFKIPPQDTVKSLDLIISFSTETLNTKCLIANITQKENTLTVILPEDAIGNVTLNMGVKTYLKALENGSAVFDFDELDSGNYTANLSYSGDSKYPGVIRFLTIPVTHNPVIPIYRLTGGDIIVLYSGDAVYRVLLTRDGNPMAGEDVIITFNGNEVRVKTDSNGYAVLKLNTNIKLGTYDISASFNGLTENNKVSVKQIIKAPNKKVKKSAKLTKVKITLKKVDGKYLAKKTLKIKFNKKTYKAKTNKKGKAIWKVKKSMLKKFKAGKKVKYTVTYGQDTLTKKLTIKK